VSRRRSTLTWVLVIAFVVVPILEIYVLIQVGQVIGAWWTILLLVLDSIFGAWLMKREGSRAFRSLSEALGSGRMPARELADGMLILAGGLLMLSPGFVTDVFGILLILPFTRPVGRRVLTRLVAARLLAGGAYGVTVTEETFGPGDARRPRPGSQGPVIEGEVVDDGPDGPRED